MIFIPPISLTTAMQVQAKMAADPKQFSRDLFRAAQYPVGWLLSAERLRDAAEIILRHEVAQEVPYFRGA